MQHVCVEVSQECAEGAGTSASEKNSVARSPCLGFQDVHNPIRCLVKQTQQAQQIADNEPRIKCVL